jgi:hypothetical protein
MDHYEVRERNGKYLVALVGNELYRDGMGMLKQHEVTKRWFNAFDTPFEAQALADKWNTEDQNHANP